MEEGSRESEREREREIRGLERRKGVRFPGDRLREQGGEGSPCRRL